MAGCRRGYLVPLLLVLLALDGDLTGVSRGASALELQTQTAAPAANEAVFAGGLNAVAIFTVLMVMPTNRLFYKAMTEGKRCAIGETPAGFTKVSRPYVHNLMPTTPSFDDSYDPVLITTEGGHTVIRPYTPHGDGSIAVMLHGGELPGAEPIEDGEMIIAINCLQFDDGKTSPTRRGILHLNNYVHDALGDPSRNPKPVGITTLRLKKGYHFCVDDMGVITVKTDKSHCTVVPNDLSGHTMDVVCEEAKQKANIDEKTYGDIGKTVHDRKLFNITQKPNGVGRKMIGILCGIAVLLAAIFPFWVVKQHPEDPQIAFSSVAPEDPLMFFIVLFTPMLFIFAALVFYGFILNTFPKATDNIQTKVIFVAVMCLICFFIPLRDFYVSKSIEKPSHYRALHLLIIISTWVSHILALMLFTNSFMNFMTAHMGYKFPVLLSPSNADFLLAFETLVGSVMGFSEMIIEEHGNGGTCRFNRIHYVLHKVFRCSGKNHLDQPCPIMDLRVTCPGRGDDVELFEARDVYNWTDWVIAANRGMSAVVEHPNYLKENFWDQGYWSSAPDAAAEAEAANFHRQLTMANLQAKAQTKGIEPPGFITRIFGYENKHRNFEDRFTEIDEDMHCLIQCGAYNSSDPSKPYWGEPQITQCAYQGVQGFDWMLMWHPNTIHRLCPGYGPTTKTPDVNNRDFDYDYCQEGAAIYGD